jgi:hypothetical protein
MAGLENYPFLTPCVEIKKVNLYGVSSGAILGRFSNAAAKGRFGPGTQSPFKNMAIPIA